MRFYQLSAPRSSSIGSVRLGNTLVRLESGCEIVSRGLESWFGLVLTRFGSVLVRFGSVEFFCGFELESGHLERLGNRFENSTEVSFGLVLVAVSKYFGFAGHWECFCIVLASSIGDSCAESQVDRFRLGSEVWFKWEILTKTLKNSRMSSSTTVDRLAAPILEGPKQWNTFKFLLEGYFTTNDYMDEIYAGEVKIISRTEGLEARAKSATEAHADSVKYVRAEKRMMAMIVRCLDVRYANQLLTCTRYTEMWAALEEIVVGERSARCLEVRNLLMAAEWRGNLGELLTYFQNLVVDYKQLGGTLDDTELTQILFRVLPEQFSSYKLMLRREAQSSKNGKFNLNDVISDLRFSVVDIPNDPKKKNNSRGGPVHGSASGSRGFGNRSSGFRGVAHRNHRSFANVNQNHGGREGSGFRNNNQNRFNGCHNCGADDHWKRECPHPPKFMHLNNRYRGPRRNGNTQTYAAVVGSQQEQQHGGSDQRFQEEDDDRGENMQDPWGNSNEDQYRQDGFGGYGRQDSFAGYGGSHSG